MKNLKFSFETSVSKKLNENATSRDEIVVPEKDAEEYGVEWWNFIRPFLSEYVHDKFTDRKDLAVIAGFDDDIQYHAPASATHHKKFEQIIAQYLIAYSRQFIKACADPSKFSRERTEYPLTITVTLPDNNDGRFRIDLHANCSDPGKDVFKIFVVESYVGDKKGSKK